MDAKEKDSKREKANAWWVKNRSEAELKFLNKIKDDMDAVFQRYMDKIGGTIDIANQILKQ